MSRILVLKNIHAEIKETKTVLQDNELLNDYRFMLESHLKELIKEKKEIRNELNRANRYKQNKRAKKKMRKLKEESYMIVNTKKSNNGSEYLTRNYVSSRKSYEKKRANKKIRQYNGLIQDGSSYKKAYPLSRNVW